MDIYRAIGLTVAAILIPLIILIVYKAVPKFRKTNPKGWYIAASIIAGVSILISLSPLLEKGTALVVCGAILLSGFMHDRKTFRSQSIVASEEVK